MSSFAQRVQKWYELGLWNEVRVREAVVHGKVSEAEYKAITGKEYAV